MSNKNILVLIVSVLALAFAMSNVSAAVSTCSTTLASDVRIEVDGLEVSSLDDLSLFAGETIPVLVVFTADYKANDATVTVGITGESDVESQPMRLQPGQTYRTRLLLTVPSDIDDRIGEKRSLEVEIAGKAAESTDSFCSYRAEMSFTTQREAYNLRILSVDMQSEVNVGESLVADIVLKNRGVYISDDTYLKIRIPELGLEENTYFGDLSPVDNFNGDNDNEDAVERRTYLRIPANVQPGLYTVQIEASNADSYDRVERRVLIGGGATENTMVVSASSSKTFSTGEKATYKLTLVNRGSVVRVYNLNVKSPDNLNVDVSEPLVVVPAGSSKTVEISADSAIRDEYNFVVDVSSDNAVIDSKTFSANVVEGNGGGVSFQSNTTVLLTVILAIVFVVLLVVLIVLLTRKPETKEEFGESYY